MPIPPLDRESVEKALESLLPELPTIIATRDDSTKFDVLWHGHRFPPKMVVARAADIQYGRPLSRKDFSGGKGGGQANTVLAKLGFTIVAKVDALGPALPLHLHQRYGRNDVYGVFGVKYDPQQRHLNVGLSPRCSDGGYFIFVTLNKEELDPAHDYDDQIFADRFIWVSRRNVNDSDPDYVNLRDPDCRVSLFVRTHPREDFVYAGELAYREHKPFIDARTSQPQIKFVWELKQPLPDALLQELTLGIQPSHKADAYAAAPSGRPGRSRAPSSFDEMKKAYSYVLGGPADRVVVPEHQNYQVKLKQFLAARGVQTDMERDFIDVAFSAGGSDYIGEIKVTRNLTVPQAFRNALGQVLEYGYLRCPNRPRMIIFLDQTLDADRLKLASSLSISVVAVEDDTFRLQNPDAAPPELAELFSASQAATA